MTLFNVQAAQCVPWLVQKRRSRYGLTLNPVLCFLSSARGNSHTLKPLALAHRVAHSLVYPALFLKADPWYLLVDAPNTNA